MLYVVERKKDIYEVRARYYQWGIGTAMPLAVLGGILSSLGSSYGRLQAEDILPEFAGMDFRLRENIDEGRYSMSILKPDWCYFKSKICYEDNNNGAMIVQIDGQSVNISFIVGSEDCERLGKDCWEEISEEEWMSLAPECWTQTVRQYFADSIKFIRDMGININFGFSL